MRFLSAAAALSIHLSLFVGAVAARSWADKSGEYELEADLVAFDDETVILRRADKELAALAIAQLSDADREFLNSPEAKDAKAKTFAAPQEWTLRDGQKLTGEIVDFADRDLVIDRRRGRIFVNDRLMNNLPEFYRNLIPQIVAHEKRLPQTSGRALRRWLIDQGDQPHVFHVQGVVIEDDKGDEFAVPFFLFSEADLKLLQPGWDEWLAAHSKKNYEEEEDQGFLLRSLAAARQQDQELQREIALMQLTMQSIQAGVTSLWEVTLYPAAGQGGPPLWVVVTGRDSNQATIAAMEKNPGYVAGPVRRISRRAR
ncbi:SHD1 domain-containing protein [Lacipirellula limnantheis]|uniref:SLA1 homology domain-containing protein n=1 Tax=Lacipirellula limnantheis TaxID=2528024 RepID=A0A517TTW6_9BACT|nr:SHD1 domain-containing protein [Lacipirellula limnantheis]QDT71822.1 hypothetical protein I41_09830 [Lacipirellula limnantheis]